MLYADSAGIASKPAERLDKRMTVIVAVFEGAGLTVSGKETMLPQTPDKAYLELPLVINAAGQIYRQTTQVVFWVASSTKTLTSRSRLNDGSVSCGCASRFSAQSCILYDGRPSYSASPHAEGQGDRDTAERVRDVGP